MSPARATPHLVVVGGGITGLAAAHELCRRTGDRARVTVLEQAPRVGGKLATSEVGGLAVDEGADSLLARRPEGLALTRAAGLADELVHPATTSAAIWTRAALRPLPAGQVMGVPADLRALAASGVLGAAELARVPLDHWLAPTPFEEDVSVGGYVAARLGRGVVDRLVEPLLGGVYAGDPHRLSFTATVPVLAAAARRQPSLLAAARAVGAAAPRGATTPVFASLRGGLGRLPGAVAARSGAEVRTGATVRGLARTPGGWRLVLGSTRSPEALDADAVLLAVPAAPAARLLRGVAPAAAAELTGIDHASVALVALAYPAAAVHGHVRGSGFLVPAVEGRTVKAATFSTRKWGWYAAEHPGTAVVRVSIGRHGQEGVLQREDAELVAAARRDLADALGLHARPLDSRVTRWGGALPQYAVGHPARVARVRAEVGRHPGLAVCGAAYDGVGVPACIASATAAVSALLAAPAVSALLAGPAASGVPAGPGLGDNGGHD